MNDVISLIGSGVKIEGVLTSEGSIRIDGFIKGDVKSNGDVVVGDTGEVTGSVSGKNVTVGGKVNGRVEAQDRMLLESSAELQGDLYTRTLVVEGGAKFDGQSQMSENKRKPAPPNTQTPPNTANNPFAESR